MTPVTLHQSLIRPKLIGGAEADLFQANLIGLAVNVLGIQTKLSVLFGIGLFAAVHWVLTLVAKNDPQWFAVYKRHTGYKPYYPARAHHGAARAPIRGMVP